MTENDQKQLCKTFWNIADQLRGMMQQLFPTPEAS